MDPNGNATVGCLDDCHQFADDKADEIDRLQDKWDTDPQHSDAWYEQNIESLRRDHAHYQHWADLKPARRAEMFVQSLVAQGAVAISPGAGGQILRPTPYKSPHVSPVVGTAMAPGATSKGARGVIGSDFEAYLAANLKGGKAMGHVKAEVKGVAKSRDFDVSYLNGQKVTWVESKSGNFWSDAKRIQKFRTAAGQQAQIANAHGARFEIHSNTPIPQSVRSWLDKRGISYVEW